MTKENSAQKGEQTLLKIAEVAELLRVSERHIYRMIELDLIPEPLRLGRSLRWTKATIDQWIEDGCPRTK